MGETQSLEITVHGVHETWNFMVSSSSSSDRMLWESSGELRCAVGVESRGVFRQKRLVLF